jgi:hypothetical protein
VPPYSSYITPEKFIRSSEHEDVSELRVFLTLFVTGTVQNQNLRGSLCYGSVNQIRIYLNFSSHRMKINIQGKEEM